MKAYLNILKKLSAKAKGYTWILIVLWCLGACGVSKTVVQQKYTVEELYDQSILQSMAPDSSKINSNLVAIGPDNKSLEWSKIENEEYLLVVAWKVSDRIYKPFLDTGMFNTGDFPVWVTTSPELRNRMKREEMEDEDLRLEQLLGLPPDSNYNYFIEFWVRPQDLFRPCPDKEIDDQQCGLCFPNNTDSTHIKWINQNRISRYYECEKDKYPWTQLGYTYDWNPDSKSHYGLSEFVIKKNSKIKVKEIYTTSEYLSQ